MTWLAYAAMACAGMAFMAFMASRRRKQANLTPAQKVLARAQAIAKKRCCNCGSKDLSFLVRVSSESDARDSWPGADWVNRADRFTYRVTGFNRFVPDLGITLYACPRKPCAEALQKRATQRRLLDMSAAEIVDRVDGSNLAEDEALAAEIDTIVSGKKLKDEIDNASQFREGLNALGVHSD